MPVVHGMQEVSGSSPLSSTSGQRPFSRSRRRAFLAPRGSLRGNIVTAPLSAVPSVWSAVPCAKDRDRCPLARMAFVRYAQLHTRVRPPGGNDWQTMAANQSRVLRGRRPTRSACWDADLLVDAAGPAGPGLHGTGDLPRSARGLGYVHPSVHRPGSRTGPDAPSGSVPNRGTRERPRQPRSPGTAGPMIRGCLWGSRSRPPVLTLASMRSVRIR